MTTHTKTGKTVSTDDQGTRSARAIRPRRRSSGGYQFDFRYTNARGEKKRTSVYGETETEVIENHATFLAGVAAQKRESDLPTMRNYAQQWIEGPLEHEDLAQGTKEGYASSIRSHLIDADLGLISIDKITAADVEEWTAYCREAKAHHTRRWSDSTNRFAFVALTKALNVAVRDGLITSNPAKLIKHPRVRSAKERGYLKKTELDYILRCSRESRYGIVLEFLAQTGMRRGEVLALTWQNIDVDHGVIKVRGSVRRNERAGLTVDVPKTRRSVRELPLTEPMRAILERARERQDRDRTEAGRDWRENDLVFSNSLGAFMEPRSVNRALAAACKRAGVPTVAPHVLRHSAATAMMDAGVPETVIATILGHENVRVTRVYEHVRMESMRDAFNKIGN